MGNDSKKIHLHRNEVAFEVCKHSLYALYEMGAEDAAKRELWDMCVIAEGETPERKWGGAEATLNDDGTLDLEKTLDPEIVKSIDAEITVET